jgi:hypothetical protein
MDPAPGQAMLSVELMRSNTMNFYASDAFLRALGDAWYPGADASVRVVSVQGHMFRLLHVEGTGYVTRPTFLDYHRPLADVPHPPPAAEDIFLAAVEIESVAVAGIDAATREGLACAPYVDWSGFKDFKAYEDELRSRSKGLIKEYERRRRRLADHHGPVQFTYDDRGDDVLTAARDWKSAQLTRTGHVNYYADESVNRFLDIMRERDLLVASTLRIKGRLVALWLGFEHDGVLSGWVFAHEGSDELRKYSVGQYLLWEMLRESFARGHREFDFSEGSEDYKWLYATHARLLGTLGSPPLYEQFRKLVADALRNPVKRVPVLYRMLKRVA